MFDCLSVVFVSFSLNFSPTKIAPSGSSSPDHGYGVVRSGNNAWPLVVGNLPSKLLYQLLISWLLQRPRVQKDCALVPSARIVDEGLRAVDATSEEGGGAHPGMCKLGTVLWRDYHAEGGIGASYLDCVRAARELERVVRWLTF